MSQSETKRDPSPWTAWTPSAAEPWNLRRVVHLHRRAGFGATWNEAQRDLADGPAAAIDRTLTGRARDDGLVDSFEELSTRLADAAAGAQDADRLKAWWLHRMVAGPDPLAERLTLLWHDHFATSNLKLNNVAQMRRQNEIFRRLSRAHFGELLRAVLHDPALLIWLDAQANRKEHPNENLGRELMELFTLGVGNYDERDVKEAARALTGWTVTDRGEFREVADHHDDGEKTILGQTGRWRCDDLVTILLAQPATARRVAFRLGELFFASGVFDAAAHDELAAQLRARDLDVGAAVATILRSRLFFCESNLGGRILSPPEFIVGAVRALDAFEPPQSTLLLAEWCTRCGQELFLPPTVFGWEGGRAWISTATLLARSRFAGLLCDGALRSRVAESPLPPPLAWMERHGVTDAAAARAQLRQLLVDEPAAAAPSNGGVETGDAAGTLAAQLARLLSSPRAQLG